MSYFLERLKNKAAELFHIDFMFENFVRQGWIKNIIVK